MAGPNKLLMEFRGKPLVRWAVEAACASRAETLVLVTGRDGDEMAKAAGAHPKLRRAHNSEPAQGLASSLRLGLTACADAEAIAVLLGDMPLIDAALIDELFARWRASAFAIVPAHEGVIGNPVVLGQDAATACATLTGDAGARKLIEARLGDVVQVPVATRSIFADIDSVADISALD
jgi:molybdenum cofactor cytidylyltransferase